jgi:hypothetical protein
MNNLISEKIAALTQLHNEGQICLEDFYDISVSTDSINLQGYATKYNLKKYAPIGSASDILDTDSMMFRWVQIYPVNGVEYKIDFCLTLS